MRALAYSIVVLAVLMLGVGVGDLFWSAHLADRAAQQDRQTRAELCTLISPAVAVPVPKPSDPAANPSRETTYEWYERYLTVSTSFGCQ